MITVLIRVSSLPIRGWFGSSLRPVSVGLLIGALFLSRLGHPDLYRSHEARAAQNALRMLDTGEWGLPVLFDGQADLQKPPGYYWLAAAVGWVNGGHVDAFAARLPATVAGLLTVGFVYSFLRQEGRPTAAVVAAVGLATAVHFTAISRTARIDVPLTCAVTLSLLAFVRGHFVLSAVAAAAGVMLKGPIALALLGTVALIWLVVAPKPTDCGRWVRHHLPLSSALLGVVIVVALSAPWFVWVNHHTGGEFVRVFFWHHNVARFAGTAATLASHPWWYYGPRLAADLLPWTPAVIGLGVWAIRSGLWRRDPLFRFGVVWAAAMFVVLSAAHFKRSDYLLPLYPGLAIAAGCAAEGWLATRQNPRTVRAARLAFGGVAALALVGWQVMTFAVEPAEQRHEEKQPFADLVRTHAPPPAEVMLFRAESHLLALHLGRPVVTRVEWHDLNDWLATPGPHFVVMPPEYVYPAQQIVRSRRLEVVARLEDHTPAAPARPLVLVRTTN